MHEFKEAANYLQRFVFIIHSDFAFQYPLPKTLYLKNLHLIGVVVTA
jgi:hypothetical protein